MNIRGKQMLYPEILAQQIQAGTRSYSCALFWLVSHGMCCKIAKDKLDEALA